MRASWDKEPVVLAIYFNTRGFGYVLFEGIMDAVDWGMKTPAQTTQAATMKHVRLLLDLFVPDIVILQRCSGPFMHCSPRVQGQIAKTCRLARVKRIKIGRYSRSDIRDCFALYGARNKVEIAQAIAERLPEFRPKVPPRRKPWVTENFHMGLFDAAALGFTHYWREQQQGGEQSS